jgi:hypothetical protein
VLAHLSRRVGTVRVGADPGETNAQVNPCGQARRAVESTHRMQNES